MPLRISQKGLRQLMETPAGKLASGVIAPEQIDPENPKAKYHATKTEYAGDVYDSKAEAEYAKELALRKAAGEIALWQRQFPVRLEVNGQLVCTYIADFYVLFPDGRYQLHEVKGFETPVWRLKRKLLRALRPDLDVLIIRTTGRS